MSNPKLIRITTVPLSLEKLLEHQLRFMSQYYEVIAISSDKPWLERIGEKEQVSTYNVEMSRQITPISDLKALWRLYRFFKLEKPLIVHTHTPKAGIVGMLAAKMAGVPHRFHTVAGMPLMETTGNKRKLLNFTERLTYKCANAVFPNSKGLKETILKEGFCVESKLKVIGNGSSNGINTSYFDPALYSLDDVQILKDDLGIDINDVVFLFVGRLVGDKGINELVSAFKKLNIQSPATKIILVGPQEQHLDPLLPDVVREIENNPSIISLGYQSDVRAYYSISDVMVLPSYREGFPNVVMQAGAMGLPCIVSNINGCNEIIIEGENGLIIPTKNEKALLEAMIKFVNNKDLLNKLKANTRKMIIDRYDQQHFWNLLLNEYNTQIQKCIK
ncbi:glycosyltransferase family 4 protein [Albibacterium bauzanense]|uniref:Glycosyltransferase involved in cell wall biosynthesis n=1 Tax=Albibacterium bauzanense TaxID=653929 RepID=A0A4V2PY78_9SPHI|nr:glycosyltransferase family 4 protein [Albibacterium bauzanense]TCK84931.1 glycosyltransferase involved in cell wall biosynthesis [Albibacterium bauzanense]